MAWKEESGVEGREWCRKEKVEKKKIVMWKKESGKKENVMWKRESGKKEIMMWKRKSGKEKDSDVERIEWFKKERV